MPRHPGHAKTRQPQSDLDWTIHAINIHGAFLEAWCRELVGRVRGWSLRYYKYPVSWQDESSDVRADTQAGLFRLSLLIECKKANPELTNWVFLRKRRVAANPLSMVANLKLQVDAAGRVGLAARTFEPFPWTSAIADDARETRGDYRSYTDK